MVSYLLRVTLLYAVWHPVHYSAMYVCVLFHDHSRINICIFFHLKSKQGSCLNLFIFYLLLAGLFKTRMWANAQRDGHPAEYRWRPLRKFRNSIPCMTPQSLADAHYQNAMQ